MRFAGQDKHFKNPDIKDDTFDIWHAGDDNDEEGVWLTGYTREPMPYLPWAPGRPHDSVAYNHLISIIYREKQNDTNVVKAAMYDKDEKYLYHPICTVQSRSLIVKLRGLCPDLSFDRDYVYTIDEDGLETYKGKEHSLIRYNRTTKLWHLFKPKDNSTLITSPALFDSFMIGLQQVNFGAAQEDKCYKNMKTQNIKLTTCTQGSFTCNDGGCVPIERRCDQTPHCQDESDEMNCKLIIMKNYNKNIAPFTVNQTNDEMIPVRVNISASVVNILKINEVDQSFQLKISLLIAWYDYRLVYHNLKESRIENSPTLDEVEKLWIPKIVFANTENNDIMKMDDLAEVTISREGTSTPADESIVDEIEIFKGSENRIYYEKGFTKTLECIYQLQLYPFDTQECTVNLEIGRYKRKMIKLYPRSIKMEGATVLTQFRITDWKLEYRDKGKQNTKNNFLPVII